MSESNKEDKHTLRMKYENERSYTNYTQIIDFCE